MAGVTIEYKGNTIATMQGESNKVLKTGGKYCEGDITVDYVPEGAAEVKSKCYSMILNSTQTGEVVMNPNGDSDIAAHYTDSTFIVGVIRKTETDVGGFLCAIGSNNNIRTGQTIYGSFARATNTAVSWGNVTKAVSTASNRVAGSITVTSSGVISVYGSTSVPLNAGEYLIMCSW